MTITRRPNAAQMLLIDHGLNAWQATQVDVIMAPDKMTIEAAMVRMDVPCCRIKSWVNSNCRPAQKESRRGRLAAELWRSFRSLSAGCTPLTEMLSPTGETACGAQHDRNADQQQHRDKTRSGCRASPRKSVPS